MLDNFFYFITGLGYQAVIVFFIISGFLVGGNIIMSLEDLRLRVFLLNRLSRLWIVVIPSILFTLVVDIYFYNQTNAYLTTTTNSFPRAELYSIEFITLLGNIFFLQEIYYPTFGSNGPLWSLSYEFWYYMMFFFLFSALKNLFQIKALPFFVSFLVILIWLPNELSILFPLWLMGAVARPIYERFIFPTRLFFVFVLLFLTIICLSRLKILDGVLSSYSIALATVLLIITSKNIENLLSARALKQTVFWTANISFSLYLFHFPLIVIATEVLNYQRFSPSFYGYFMYCLVAFSIIIVTFIFWFIFEKNTDIVRANIRKLL